jgi:ABC-type transporter Mla subunit MlaD
MDDKQYYLRLGLFVVVSFVILFAVLFILGAKSLFQPSLTVETYFNESVSGLGVGAPLKYRGVPFGEVTAIDLSTLLYEQDVPVDQRKTYIVVRAKVVGNFAKLWRRDLEAYVARGLHIRTQVAGITGQQQLTLEFVDPQKARALPFSWKPDYPVVPSAPSFASEILSGIQNLVSNLDKADIQQLGQNLNTLVVNANKKLDELPVAELSTNADGLLRDARATINRVQAPLDQTLRNLSAASARVDALLADPALGQTVGNAAAITGRLRKTVEGAEIDRIVKKLDLTLQRVDALLADNQYDIRGVVQDLRVAASNLRTVTENAKRYPPGVLISGPPEKVQVPNNPKKESK